MRLRFHSGCFILLLMVGAALLPPAVRADGHKARPMSAKPASIKSPHTSALPADPDVERAQRLAETHLALQNTRWGEPKNVEETADRYIFSYDTPKVEQRLLGQRQVTVQKSSGLVRVRDRR